MKPKPHTVHIVAATLFTISCTRHPITQPNISGNEDKAVLSCICSNILTNPIPFGFVEGESRNTLIIDAQTLSTNSILVVNQPHNWVPFIENRSERKIPVEIFASYHARNKQTHPIASNHISCTNVSIVDMNRDEFSDCWEYSPFSQKFPTSMCYLQINFPGYSMDTNTAFVYLEIRPDQHGIYAFFVLDRTNDNWKVTWRRAEYCL